VVIFQPNVRRDCRREYQLGEQSTRGKLTSDANGGLISHWPEKGKLQQSSRCRAGGNGRSMQVPIDKTNNHYSIAFAFRPGDNAVVFYELPYTGNAANRKKDFRLLSRCRLLVVAATSGGAESSGEGLPGRTEGKGGGRLNLYVPSGGARGHAGCRDRFRHGAPRGRECGAEAAISAGQAGRQSPGGGELGVSNPSISRTAVRF